MGFKAATGITAAALILSGCSGPGPTPDAPAPVPATPAPPPPAPSPATAAVIQSPEELVALAGQFLDRRTLPEMRSLIRSMGATGDPRWAPYLLDLRLVSGEEAFPQLREAFAAVSGVPPPDDPAQLFVHYGGWLYDAAVDPGEEYIAWKAELYSLIDDEFTDLILQIDDPVLAGRLQWGGVTVGGIPELNHQRTIGVEEADYMTPDELTFGAVVGGQARSYPHRILDFHELANDTLGGEPVALANCTLCRTGMLFSRKVGDLVLDFQTSGLLWNSNKVMVDVQTRTLWRQLTGDAIAGELKGATLEALPLTVTRYGDWIAEHPNTDVVAIPGGGRDLVFGGGAIPQDFGYSYEPDDAYRDYYADEGLWFPSFDVPDTFDAKELVATLALGDGSIAVGVDDLAGAAGPLLLEVGGERVLAVSTGAGARFYLVPQPVDLDAAPDDTVALPPDADVGESGLQLGGVTLKRLTSSHSFWFAWHGNFPDTETWPP